MKNNQMTPALNTLSREQLIDRLFRAWLKEGPLEEDLSRIRRAAQRVDHLLGSYQITYRGTGPNKRDEAFRLLKKMQRNTLTEDDFPKTWGHLKKEEKK